MGEGLLYVAVGAAFVIALGRLAHARGRIETARAGNGAGLSPLTQVLMLTAFGGFGATMAVAAWTRAWPLEPAPGWAAIALRVAGLLLVVLGGVIVAAVFVGTRKRTWAVDTDTLATTGIYGRTRNPRALGWFLVYTGVALASGSGAALALTPIYLLGYLPWILLEEVALERHFGDMYRAYRHRTPRFI